MFKSFLYRAQPLQPVRRLLTSLLILLAVLASGPRAAQAFEPSRGLATPVPQNRWGLLSPESIVSNQTLFAFESQITASNPFFLGMDIENGWVFGSTGRGLVLYDARNTPGSPAKKPTFFASTSNVPNWEVNDLKFYTFGVDAPEGVDTVAAMGVINSNGLFIFDTANKEQAPLLKYQDNNKSGKEVWAATFGGTHYAFFASDKGALIYNMSAAKSLTATCLDSTPAVATCRDGQNRRVYVDKVPLVPANAAANYLSGAGNYLAISRGFQGVDIFNVSNPVSSTSIPKVATVATPGSTAGVALWQDGAKYYLATVQVTNFPPRVLNIYDVSCITSGSGCAGTLVKSYPMNHAAPSAMIFVTFSRAGSTPFLYVGGEDSFSGTPQREYLLDVTTPANPVDVTPTTHPDGYWGWYYFGNPTGFNWVMPRLGKFHNNYFYRAAYALFDIHKYSGNLPPGAGFSYSPTTVYAGDPVTFTDQSTGTVSSWSWSFSPDGSPSLANGEGPHSVTFAAPGQKSVTLTINGGEDSEVQPLTVLNPAPVIGGNPPIIPVPANPRVCQQVAFSAPMVTGKQPLNYSWQILNTDGSPLIPAVGGSGTTFNWSTGNALAQDYKVQLTVTNTGNPPAVKDVQFTLAPLGSLPTAPFAPTAPAGPLGLTVTFGLPSSPAELQNASEWSWDFGDGQGWSAWSSDPVTGPSPTKTYASIGTYNVKVRVKNCQGPTNGIESTPITIVITQILEAKFDPVCFGGLCSFGTTDAVAFIDQSVGVVPGVDFWDYDWNADGTFEESGRTTPVSSHTFTTPGTYRPKMRVRKATGGESTVYQVPAGKAITVTQSTGGGGGGSPSISVNGASSANVGQSITLTASASRCTAPNTGGASNGWTWQTDGGTGTSTTSSITLSWATSGPKRVVAKNSACGSTQGERTVTVGGGGGGGGLAASFTYAPVPVFRNQAVSFNGSASTGNPTLYMWDFGDGSTATGAQVTHTFTQSGSFAVKLTVTGPGSCAPAPFCESSTAQTVQVTNNTPTLAASFNSEICVTELGFVFCNAATGQEVTFVDASTGNVVSRTWDFGDGETATGSPVKHTYKRAGNYQLTLTVSDGTGTNSLQRSIVVTGGPTTEAMILPWIAKTVDGALVQSSDFYLHNPGTESIDVTLEFRRRGTPENAPPKATRTIAANATLFVSDIVKAMFNRQDVTGFIAVTVDRGNVQPVVMSFNTTFQDDGSEFGQTIPGYVVSNTGVASTTGTKQLQHLVGLNDNTDRFAYFGLSNPSGNPVSYRLRFFDSLGREIGTGSQTLTLPRNGAKQYQVRDIRTLFGVSDKDDYRVMVESDKGAPLFPYGANLRIASNDPSFVSVGTGAERVFLLGALSTPGANNSIWQSDLVISNTSNQVVLVDIAFNNVGVNSNPTDTIHETLQPGETRRLEDVIGTKWNIRNGVGVLTLDSDAPGGLFPLVQGESYENTNPAKRYGQTLPALTDKQAAGQNQAQYLVGLRHDAKYRTTFWVLNPGPNSGEYEITYRALDGRAIGPVQKVNIGAGKLRQFNQSNFPPGIEANFTVQIRVKGGKVLAAAQVVNNRTNDPAYIQGETR